MIGRSESLEHWRRVAAGDLERDQYDAVDLHGWIKTVAAGLLDADTALTGLRPGEIVRAVGLLGVVDPNHGLREILTVHDEFPFADTPRRGQRMAALIAAARASGLVPEDVSDPELRKRIERMLCP